MRGGWRDSLWFAAIELVLFIAVFEAGSYNYLPVSHTPWLFLLCWRCFAYAASDGGMSAFDCRILGRSRSRSVP